MPAQFRDEAGIVAGLRQRRFARATRADGARDAAAGHGRRRAWSSPTLRWRSRGSRRRPAQVHAGASAPQHRATGQSRKASRRRRSVGASSTEAAQRPSRVRRAGSSTGQHPVHAERQRRGQRCRRQSGELVRRDQQRHAGRDQHMHAARTAPSPRNSARDTSQKPLQVAEPPMATAQRTPRRCVRGPRRHQRQRHRTADHREQHVGVALGRPPQQHQQQGRMPPPPPAPSSRPATHASSTSVATGAQARAAATAGQAPSVTVERRLNAELDPAPIRLADSRIGESPGRAATARSRLLPSSRDMQQTAHPRDPSRVLHLGARAWFLAAMLGQGPSSSSSWFFGGHLAGGDHRRPECEAACHRLRARRRRGNVQFVGHALAGRPRHAVGAWQLVPALRRRWPRLHRWNGCVFLAIAVLATLSGFWRTWVRGSQLGTGSTLSISLNGLLILGFAWAAWRVRCAATFGATAGTPCAPGCWSTGLVPAHRDHARGLLLAPLGSRSTTGAAFVGVVSPAGCRHWPSRSFTCGRNARRPRCGGRSGRCWSRWHWTSPAARRRWLNVAPANTGFS